jgi:hypothetical protein
VRSPALLCGALGKNGPCQAYRAAGSTRCHLHGENAAQEIAARHQAAAQVRSEEAAKLRLDTPEQIQAFVEETAARLRAGQIPAATAVALDRLARTSLAAIDSALLAEAQAEIQASKGTRPTGVRRR